MGRSYMPIVFQYLERPPWRRYHVICVFVPGVCPVVCRFWFVQWDEMPLSICLTMRIGKMLHNEWLAMCFLWWCWFVYAVIVRLEVSDRATVVFVFFVIFVSLVFSFCFLFPRLMNMLKTYWLLLIIFCLFWFNLFTEYYAFFCCRVINNRLPSNTHA